MRQGLEGENENKCNAFRWNRQRTGIVPHFFPHEPEELGVSPEK